MLDFNSKIFLAPMAGITDYPFRKITSGFGGGVMFSEMVAINALNRKNPKTYRIADVRNEPYPVVVQLVGGDPELFPEAVKLVEELGAYSIDINMGCPVKKIVCNNSGSHLMKDIKTASLIIKQAVKSTKLKVSCKFRKGWDSSNVNAVEFAKMCEDSGASFITVHGRTRSQGYSGKADWDIIAEVKNSVSIPVIGNGDVTSAYKAKEMLEYTKADGVMIARGALGSPWVISEAHDYIEKNIVPTEPSIQKVKELLLTHIKELTDYYGMDAGMKISRKFACWYCKDIRDARKFRELYNKNKDYEQAIALIDQFFKEA